MKWFFFFTILGLNLFGIIFIYNSSSAQALNLFGDKFLFVKDQFRWACVGIGLALTISRVDYRRLFNLSPFVLLGCIVLLILVFLPVIGVHANGASRWINLGFATFQPSELTKLATIIYLAAWFSVKDQKRILSFIFLLTIVVGLIILQPDMGTAVIIGLVGMTLFFLTETKIWHVISLILAIIPAGWILAVSSPYRFKRIVAFFDPQSDPLGSSYHIRQSLISFGSGGLWGIGLGNSRQKYAYLPEANTDSIFAIIGEEIGLIGCFLVICIFVFFMFKGVKLALELEQDRFGQMLVMGIVSWIFLQAMINISSMIALLPLTGVPLPFVSYGGSALIMQWIGIGILMSIVSHRHVLTNKRK